MMKPTDTPLAERMRPNVLEEFIGQQHLLKKGSMLANCLQNNYLPSLILWGPPGVGKTTLARLLATKAGVPLVELSAINAGVKEIRDTIKSAREKNLFKKKTILFIDEIHRFSKSQQDSLLGAVEDGTICLIGATTENPSFEVIPALLSRAQVLILESHSAEELLTIVKRALEQDKWLASKNIQLEETDFLLRYSGGDARRLLNILEIIAESSSENITITNALVEQTIKHNAVRFDKGGEEHYNIISALIKSIRGSHADAAVYWLARLLVAGEDLKFIARRLIILAAEDIGLANPNALLLAESCFRAVHHIGMPEARIILSETVIYLANTDKSNSAYTAINKAMQLVKDTGNLSVPLHLRNAPTKLMKDLGYGKDYKYAHDFEGNYVEQQFLPDDIKNTKFYAPGSNAAELKMKATLDKRKGKDKNDIS